MLCSWQLLVLGRTCEFTPGCSSWYKELVFGVVFRGGFISAWLGRFFLFPFLWKMKALAWQTTVREEEEIREREQGQESPGMAGITLGKCLAQPSEGKISTAASSSPPIPSSKAHGRDLDHEEMSHKGIISPFLATSCFQSHPSLAGGCRGPGWGCADV